MIIAAMQLGLQLINWGKQAYEGSQQNTEWTKEQEERMDALIAQIGTKPEDQDTGK